MTDRKSKLPEANKMARSIRSGCTVGDLTVRYGVNSHVITNQLVNSGWDPATGVWVGDNRPYVTPLSARGDGAGFTCHHVGGGDNPGVVPTTPRPFTERVRPKFQWPDPDPNEVRRPPAPRKLRRVRPYGEERGRPGGRLTAMQRAEIVQRYIGGEPSTALGPEYGVDDRTVRKLLRRTGVPVRSRSEALKLRYAQQRERDKQQKEAG